MTLIHFTGHSYKTVSSFVAYTTQCQDTTARPEALGSDRRWGLDDAGETPAALRDRVFDAVLAEVADTGIDEFSIDAVARRVGVAPEVILSRWHDRRVLLMEAMLARANHYAPIPDSGSLDEDLRQFAASLAQLSASEHDRQWLHLLLPGGRDADLSKIGRDFCTYREGEGERILRRAAERGELRPGLDTLEATRMLAAALHYDLTFTDSPIRPEYAAQVREIFLYGILAPRVHDGRLIEDFENREHMRALLRATTDAMIDPVALFEAVRDGDGRVTDFTFREVNPAACVYLQRRRDELIGGSLKEAQPQVESSGLLARFVDCLQTGHPIVVEDFEYFSLRYQQMLRYDLRGARAGTDWLSLTWRNVTERYARHQHKHSGGMHPRDGDVAEERLAP